MTYLRKTLNSFSTLLTFPTVFFTMLLLGCSEKVEIPKDYVGIVVNPNGNVDKNILKPGIHSLENDSNLIIFSMRPNKVDVTVEFFFADNTRGNLKFSVTFVPIASKLPSYYEKYRYEKINVIVIQESMIAATKTLKYQRKSLFSQGGENKIIEEIKEHIEISEYVEIQKVDSFQLTNI
jgi:hypothetical protein